MPGSVPTNYRLMYPWQIEDVLARRFPGQDKTGYRSDKAYDEWQCAFVHDNVRCPIMVNNVATKNKKKLYCPEHRRLVTLLSGRERCRRWYQKKYGEPVLP